MFERVSKLLRTTTFRLVTIYLAAFALAGAAVVVLVLWQLSSQITSEALRAILAERAELSEIVRTRGPVELAAVVRERGRQGAATLYFLGSGEGEPAAGNLSRFPPELASKPEGGTFRYAAARGERLAVGVPVAIAGGGQLVVARDIEEGRALAERMRRSLLLGFAALVAAGLAGGILASRHLLRRIDAVTATSRSIMSGDLSRRIPLAGTGDEIDGLAAGLNQMLDRIEQLLAGMREVSDNIAHDLKTPLNRMRTRMEAALNGNGSQESYKQGLVQALAEADAIIKTFNALLLIARLEAGAIEESLETFDVTALVRDLAELYEPVAEEAGLALAVTDVGAVSLRGNRQLLGQAITNLLDNAIKYASTAPRPGGGPGRIDVGVSRTARGIQIVVADQGPGIPAEDRERALKRFVRLDASRTRPGTGLGLSLVSAVARLHGGAVRLEDNHPGLRVVVTLPPPANDVAPALRAV